MLTASEAPDSLTRLTSLRSSSNAAYCAVFRRRMLDLGVGLNKDASMQHCNWKDADGRKPLMSRCKAHPTDEASLLRDAASLSSSLAALSSSSCSACMRPSHEPALGWYEHCIAVHDLHTLKQCRAVYNPHPLRKVLCTCQTGSVTQLFSRSLVS